MNKCATVDCPNPPVQEGELCAICLGLKIATKSSNDFDPTNIKKVTTKGSFGGKPKAAKDKAYHRVCAAPLDKGTRKCENKALKDSPWCKSHDKARRKPEFENKNFNTIRCSFTIPPGKQCKRRANKSGFCNKHEHRTEGATVNVHKPSEVGDIRAQLEALHASMARMQSIVDNGVIDKDRINAARALERMMSTGERLHRRLIQIERAQKSALPANIYGLTDGDTNRIQDHLDKSFDEWKSSLPEGDSA